MIYSKFQDKQLSLLGFGIMRFPLLPDGSVDEAQVQEMTDYAMSHGVNYFDTAYPYHGGKSETIIGRALKEYPRESFYLADKYPGHQLASSYDPAAVFEDQLQKCGVEYFDFYLLHNVYERAMEVYLDPRWGIIDYFKEQKRLGRIRHLGFSSHASVESLRTFLDRCGEDMEFCQIQLNYLDWTMQRAKEQYELLTERGIPVWVMEPVRGGKLASLGEAAEEKLRSFRAESSAAWAFRFLQGLPNVKMILSGMSNMEQMQENVATFAESRPLSDAETALVLDIAETLKNSVPCTACRYCCDGCPQELDIPGLLALYNELRVQPAMGIVMRAECFPEGKRAADCIACGACTHICPQNIDIPAAMADFAERLAKLPSWAAVCREREEAAKKNK